MKKSLIFIAVAMVATLLMVSCKNNKKAKEPTSEEVQAQKVALADSVLAKIDEYAQQYIKYSDDADFVWIIKLTDEEKMVKPDYLLDPAEVSNFVTKTQKVNALAIYDMEYYLRLLYDMPVNDVKEVIAKLAVELNHPIDGDFLTSDRPTSDFIREEYNVCKERGELAYFWQFQNAIIRETDFLLAKNPELFINKVGDENLNAYGIQWASFKNAIRTLAPYDEEIAIIYDIFDSAAKNMSNEEVNQTYYGSRELIIDSYKNNLFDCIGKRNALLQ